MEERCILKNQKGFTLIEIIAVLVILGVLAAVAVPKYLDLQTEARDRSVEAAFAAASSNINLAFAKNILNGVTPSNVAGFTNPAIETALGDFTAAYATGTAAGTIDITLTSSLSWFGTYAGAKTKNVKAPY